ncbi:hypothetical protein Taro_032809 [Colocasia esculenta]|uniref:Uncharacterized protein n=1 Tax=Colocasia esculenta TaxID=4460 RepID=A0A843WAJ2_COLES|nr:hypothetical protein [Colocasia esculenta]
MYTDNAYVDGKVLQGTLNVIGRLPMTPEKRLKAVLQSWVEVRENIDDPVFYPIDTRAEGILDGDEPKDLEFRVPAKEPSASPQSSKEKQLEIVEGTEKQFELEPPRYSKSDNRSVTPKIVKPPPSLRRTTSGIYMIERASDVVRDDSTIEKMGKIYARRMSREK